LALGCAKTMPPQLIVLPRPMLPTSYTAVESVPCPTGDLYQDVIEWAQKLRQIVEKLNQKLEAIKKWEIDLKTTPAP